MFETIKRLYDTGRLKESGVDMAVKKRLITKREAKEILSGKSKK